MEVVTTSSACAGYRPAGSTETHEENNMCLRVSSEVSNINTHNDQNLEEEAPKGEESNTPNWGDKTKLAPIGDVPLHIDLSTKVTDQNSTPPGDTTYGTSTCGEKVERTTYIGAQWLKRIISETCKQHTRLTKKHWTSDCNWIIENSCKRW